MDKPNRDAAAGQTIIELDQGGIRGAPPERIVDKIRQFYLQGIRPKEIAKMLNINPVAMRRHMFMVRTSLRLSDYTFSPEVRREIAQSTINKVMVENADSRDPNKQRLALMAAAKVLDDPEVQSATQQIDMDKISRIGGGKIIDISSILAKE